MKMKKIEVRQVQMQTLTTVLLYFLLGNRFGYAYRTGTGYISIDCGNNQPDKETMKSDSEYIDTGTNAEIMNPYTLKSSDYIDAEPLKTLRSFPDGSNRSSRLNPKNRQFTESEMTNITNNYSTPLGQGGFAIVYLGTLNHTQVAVKLLNQNSTLKIFQSEAELLMRVYHKNLVSLVGYCDAGNTMALVYEYMANGDLKKYLSAAEQKNISGWKQRLHIAVDIAQGLEYLHYGCKPPIVHRDIKPANILLDDNLNAKISDFGMSRMFPSEADNDFTKSYLVGTFGYMDPDNGGRLNERSDVYSFGVILLELITGLPAIQRGKNEKYIHITNWVNSMLSNEEADIRSILDQRFNGDYSIESAQKAVEIAMECVRLIGIQRPDMSVVMTELKLSLAIENDHNPAGSITQLRHASSSTSSNAIFDIEQAHQQF